MIWQENVELIIMLCRTLEENRKKCAQYWPLNPGQMLTFCGITIQTVEVSFYLIRSHQFSVLNKYPT